MSALFGHIFERDFDKSNYEENLGVAMYMEGLLKLMTFRMKELQKGGDALPTFIPRSIRHKIFAEFTEDGYDNSLININ